MLTHLERHFLAFFLLGLMALSPARGQVAEAGEAVWHPADGTLFETGHERETSLVQGFSVNVLVASPGSQEILYAGTEGGGFFRSEDGGTSWRGADQGLESRFVTALAFDPERPGHLYAGTDLGVFRSSDGGAHWRGGSPGWRYPPVSDLALDPRRPGVLYAATAGGGVLRSTDAGQSWYVLRHGLRDLEVTALAVDPRRTHRIYAGTRGRGVFYSPDAGASWREIGRGLADPFIVDLVVSSTHVHAAGADGGFFKLAVLQDLIFADDFEAGDANAWSGGNSFLPIASAGDDGGGRLGLPVYLNSRGSYDPDGDPVSFQWILESAPPGSAPLLIDSQLPVAQLIGDVEGFYEIALEVDDGSGIGRDQVRIYIDFDGDAIPQAVDPDRDGDQVADVDDLFPDDPLEFADSDGDGEGNFADQDEDGDGVVDRFDFRPFDALSVDYPTTAESEFNDNPSDADATGASAPLRVSGVIQQDIDGDFFRFTAQAGDSLTAVLTTTAEDFRPSLTLADSSGNPLPSVIPQFNFVRDLGAAISSPIGIDGEYLIIVTDLDSRGAADFSYTVEIFIDRDVDALDDERELALGVNPGLPDSDFDGIFDLSEVYARGPAGTFDLDSDGVPHWLDDDSDGDGVPDAVEGGEDLDGDRLASFADQEADGNGVFDVSEAGLDPTRPADADFDGRPDLIDLDDENDGLWDIYDEERLYHVPVADILDPANQLFVDLARIELRPGVAARDVMRPGDRLRLIGEGFSNVVAENVVIFLAEDGTALFNVLPESASPGELEVVVPFAAGEVPVSVAVVSRQLKSNRLAVRYLDRTAPVLAEQNFISTSIGDVLTVIGESFNSSMNVSFGGVQAAPFAVGAESFQVSVPFNAASGGLTTISAAGVSNRVPLDVTTPRNAQVTVPAGVALAPFELTLSFGLLGEAAVGFAGSAQIEIDNSGLDMVYALLPASVAGPETVVLQAATLPGDGLVELDEDSTAVAIAMTAAAVELQVDPASYAAARTLVAGLPEVQVLAQAVTGGLLSNVRFLGQPDPAFARRIETAAAAVQVAIDSGIGNGTLLPPENLIGIELHHLLRDFVKATLADPEITPPEQDDVKVFSLGDGDVGVENDTQLFLSARFEDTRSGEELFPHIDGYFDPNMVGPQRFGLLFYASEKDDYRQCRFRDCQVEVLTGSFSGVGSDRRVANYLFFRTLSERVLFPAFEAVLGKKLANSSELVKILATHLDTTINIAGGLAANGNVIGAVEIIVDAILEDLLSVPPGPITRALATRVAGSTLVQSALEELARKLAVKLVPVVGQLSLLLDAWDILSNVNTGLNIGKTIADLSLTPGRLEFDVDYPLEITDLSPKVVRPEREAVGLRIEGQGFNPIERGFSIFTTTVRPKVKLIDLGRSVFMILDHPQPSFDGTRLDVTMPSSFLDGAVGPIQVEVLHDGAVASSAPLEIQVSSDLTIAELDPPSGISGTLVKIKGVGFSLQRDQHLVTFEGPSGRIPANVLFALPDELLVTAPPGVVTGPVTVQLGAEISNALTFTAEGGTVTIDFGDNGSANDDTFSLIVDGQLIHAMPAPTRSAGPFELSLAPGFHDVKLRGITAPDNIGTYFISFSGNVIDIVGDPLSGSDLTAGREKNWRITVGNGTAPPLRASRVPILWQE